MAQTVIEIAREAAAYAFSDVEAVKEDAEGDSVRDINYAYVDSAIRHLTNLRNLIAAGDFPISDDEAA